MSTLTISNLLSFFRAPLAFLFLQENPTLRIVAVFLAMTTDSIDGYFARKNRSMSQFGAILDPAMDKFFVYFALTVLCLEGRLASWEATAMLARDIFLCLFGLYRFALGQWKTIVFRAIRWGKATTALQFVVLILAIIDISCPWYCFAAFLIMGCFAFLELFQLRPSLQ